MQVLLIQKLITDFIANSRAAKPPTTDRQIDPVVPSVGVQIVHFHGTGDASGPPTNDVHFVADPAAGEVAASPRHRRHLCEPATS